MRLPGNFHIDDPAFPLVLTHISYWDVTSAAGNVLGTSLVCANLANEPSYQGFHAVKVLDGDAAGQIRPIATHPAGGNTVGVANAFTDNTGAVVQIIAGTRFVILSTGAGGGGAAPLAPSIGLWMFGECDPGMAASTTALLLTNLAGFPDNIFNDQFYVQVIYNTNAVGVAPEGEIRLVTDYVGATGMFTCDAFSANVEAFDLVCVIHESLIPRGLNVIGDVVQANFSLLNAMLRLMETNGSVTLDGNEQDMYRIETPAGVFEPKKVMIDMSNQTAAETVVVRVYYRIVPGGGLVKKEEVTYAGVQDPELINVELEPNRFGIRVSIERTAGGNIAYPWAVFYGLGM